METFAHDLPHLFKQLGLPNKPLEIETFISRHKLRDDGNLLQEADFWTIAQANFIEESILEDSDWVEAIDELSALLHH